jgi:hypothetical protein
VREHYLRDDIYSGTSLDPECDPSAFKLSADAAAYVVVDTNVVLHQVCMRVLCMCVGVDTTHGCACECCACVWV